METILITGITGKLGKEFAYHFLEKGYQILGVYRDKEKYKNLFGNKNNLFGIQVDLMQNNAADVIIEAIQECKIYPHYLVNNATNSYFHKIEDNGFSKRDNFLGHYIINVIIPYEISFKLANHPKSRLKKIINISSMYGVIPYNPSLYSNPLIETPLQYSVAKAALIHLTKELAIRFSDKEINVNSISYGGVDGRVDDTFKEKFAKVTPLKRMMQPNDVVGALEFLLTDGSNYMTGHNLIVDGGRTIW